METLSDNKILTTKEVSEILNLHPETVKGLIRKGDLPAFKPGGHEWRIKAIDLEEWMERKKEKVKRPAFDEVAEFKSSDYQNLLKGGIAMKVKKVADNRWFAGFGGFYWKKDSNGIKRWYIWWYDEKDKRKFKCVKTDDSKIPDKVRITKAWAQVTNEAEALIALKAELEKERMKAFAKKVARYNPDEGEKLIEALGIEEDENGDSIKFSELMDAWHKDYAQVNLADKGKGAEAVIRYWNGNGFSKKKATEITKGEIKSHFAEELRRIFEENKRLEKDELDEVLRKAKQTQRNRGAVLRSMYNWAIEMDKYDVKVNPVEGALPKKEEKESESFTMKELDLLFQKAGEVYLHMLEPMAYATITGGRIGELESLKWENVNLEEGWIKIVRPKEKKFKKIYFNPNCALYKMFESMKKDHDSRDERDFKDGEYAYVFVYWNPRYEKWGRVPIADHFLEIRKLVGIRSKSFHTFRHTAGSLAVSNGANAQAVQALYGHSTIDMTQHYLHASEEDRVDALKKVEERVNIGNLLNGNGAKVARLTRGN